MGLSIGDHSLRHITRVSGLAPSPATLRKECTDTRRTRLGVLLCLSLTSGVASVRPANTDGQHVHAEEPRPGCISGPSPSPQYFFHGRGPMIAISDRRDPPHNKGRHHAFVVRPGTHPRPTWISSERRPWFVEAHSDVADGRRKLSFRTSTKQPQGPLLCADLRK